MDCPDQTVFEERFDHRENEYETYGSCLCGEVRFEIEGSFEGFYLCHCDYCRKDTGSAHASNLFSSTANLVWVSGKSRITLFTLPSTRHTRSFCSICGSALPYVQVSRKLLVDPAGSLDSEVSLKPNAHIFVSSRANWDHELEEIPMIERLPT
ncbi:MAG: GFA family protein [Lyngbya sp. HA4199-MV5]|nr:GFA family protein [Lyngbya sp. HA4199-MV5]